MPSQAPLHLLWQICCFWPRGKLYGVWRAESAEQGVGQGTTKDNIARDEKDYRGLAKKLGELTCQSCAQTYLVRLLALMVKGLESILRKGCFCSWPCHLLDE